MFEHFLRNSLLENMIKMNNLFFNYITANYKMQSAADAVLDRLNSDLKSKVKYRVHIGEVESVISCGRNGYEMIIRIRRVESNGAVLFTLDINDNIDLIIRSTIYQIEDIDKILPKYIERIKMFI